MQTLLLRNGKVSVSGQRFSMLPRKEVQPTKRPKFCQPNCKLKHNFQNTLLEFDPNDPKYYQNYETEERNNMHIKGVGPKS